MAPVYGGDIPSLSSLGGLILLLTALSGELPATLIFRLSLHDAYLEKVVKSLKGKRLLRTYSRDGLRGFRLTSFAKKSLLERWPDLFGEIFVGQSATNAPGYKTADRLRLHRMAEVLVTMLNAGVSVYPWEKPDLFSPTPLDEAPHFECPAYYSSRELKRIGKQASEISSSRAVGVLLSNDEMAVIYNTGAGRMKWSARSETRLVAMLQVDICQARLAERFAGTKQNAILFGSSMSQLPELAVQDSKQCPSVFSQERDFPHIYFLTNDQHGEVILRLLNSPGEKAKLDDLLGHGLSDPRPDQAVENDAMDGDTPVMFGYTCDVPRIRGFSNLLDLQNRTGILYCFDFQEGALRQICGQSVKIQCLDFATVKALLDNNAL